MVHGKRGPNSAGFATQVWERLWVGGLADAEDLTVSNPVGITAVIGLSELPVSTKRQGIAYLHIPIEDGHSVPARQLAAILDAISEHIKRGSALLHCTLGMSRAPSIAAAYMHAVGYKNLDAALAEIKRVRPIVDPSPVLFTSLKENLQ